MSVRVKNTGRRPFVDRFAGETYRIDPGEVAVIPDGAARLWLGDFRDPEQVDEERKRAAFRRGGQYPPLEIVEPDSAPPPAPPEPEAQRPARRPPPARRSGRRGPVRASVAEEEPPSTPELVIEGDGSG